MATHRYTSVGGSRTDVCKERVHMHMRCVDTVAKNHMRYAEVHKDMRNPGEE